MRKLVKASLFAYLAVSWLSASSVSAATLVIVDDFGGSETTWTLVVEDSCQFACDVTLTAFFEEDADGGDNAFTGSYLDAVQWVVSQPNVSPTDVELTSTTAGTVDDWEFDIDESLSGGNQCGGGAKDSVCGEWISGGTADGFGPIVNDSTLTWTFLVDWDALLTAATSGNIRASFNNSEGTNIRTFSPDGGTFTTDEPTTTDQPTTTDEPTTTDVPEPAILGLLGAGLLVATRRLRRRKE